MERKGEGGAPILGEGSHFNTPVVTVSGVISSPVLEEGGQVVHGKGRKKDNPQYRHDMSVGFWSKMHLMGYHGRYQGGRQSGQTPEEREGLKNSKSQ